MVLAIIHSPAKGEVSATSRASTWAGGLLRREEMSVNPSHPSGGHTDEALSCILPEPQVLIGPSSDSATGLNKMHIPFQK